MKESNKKIATVVILSMVTTLFLSISFGSIIASARTSEWNEDIYALEGGLEEYFTITYESPIPSTSADEIVNLSNEIIKIQSAKCNEVLNNTLRDVQRYKEELRDRSRRSGNSGIVLPLGGVS